MKHPIAVCGHIYWVGVNDYETQLFENLWPLPKGVSYNSYLIVDDKIALIDTVKQSFLPNLVSKIEQLLPPGRTLDYLVINHMEPDHSGSLKLFPKLFPEMKIVGNKRTAEFLESYYGITSPLMVVNEGDVLDLGHHKLTFYLTPMIHWPETMMTYETTAKILFSGDAFGGFGALEGGIFDDEVKVDYFENETLRYFSNIVGKFSPMVQKALARLKGLEIETIAAAHGPIWRQNPHHILKQYDRWSSHQTEPGAVIAYGSMYANTQRMAEAVARALAEAGVKEIRMHHASTSHLSYILTDAWRFKGLALGSCTYDNRLFPPLRLLLDFLKDKGAAENRHLGIFGSYGWSGGAVKEIQEFASVGNWTVVEPTVQVKGAPTMETLEQCFLLGKNLAEAIKS
ncbi:MAG: FprA family A-type flavoprotein [Desulfobaccales bacterium]